MTQNIFRDLRSWHFDLKHIQEGSGQIDCVLYWDPFNTTKVGTTWEV